MRVSKQAGEQQYLLHPEKKGKMQLPVAIDGAHMARINERMAAITDERVKLEAKKKAMLEPVNKRLAQLRQSEKDLVSERDSGQTMIEVEVQERASLEDGTAWLVRLDTGMEVPDTRRPLTPAERNAFSPARPGEEPRQLFPRRVPEDAEPDQDDEDEDEESVPESEETAESPPDDETPPTGSSRSPYQHPVPERPGERVFQLEAPLDAWCVRWPAVGMDLYFYSQGATMGSAAWEPAAGHEGAGDWRRSSDAARVPGEVLTITAEAIRSGSFRRPSREELEAERRADLEASPVTCDGAPDCRALVPATASPRVCAGCQAKGYPIPEAPEGSGLAAALNAGARLYPLRVGWYFLIQGEQVWFAELPSGKVTGGFAWSAEASALVRAPSSRVPELWPDEHGDLLEGVATMIARGAVPGLNELPQVPSAEEEPRAVEGRRLYPLPGLKGWAIFVAKGLLWFQDGAGRVTGPFRWKAAERMTDRATPPDGDTPVPDEWMKPHEDHLTAADQLLVDGVVLEAFDGYTPPTPSRPPPSTPPAGGETSSDPADVASGEAPADVNPNTMLPEDEARTVGAKLSDFGKKTLAILLERGAMSTPAIGSAVHCAKPGGVLNYLHGRALVGAVPEGYDLTPRGRAVAEALKSKAAKKK